MLITCFTEAVSGNKTSVDFDSEPDVYVKADITSDNPDLQASLNACNNSTKQALRILLEMKRKLWMEIRSRTG